MESSIPRPILLISQTFPPDPAAVGQHFGDVATELARRGYPVVVVTSARGYDDPSARYSAFERTSDGVEVRRTRLSSLGKSTLLLRVVASVAFMVQALVAGLRTKRLGGVLFSTSPPLVGIVGALIGLLRGVPVAYWVMDVNPDQLVALGKLSPASPVARLLTRVNAWILRRSAIVVALDHMMARRLSALSDRPLAMTVIPPWSPDDALTPAPREPNAFRDAHRLAQKTVVMYSGNHTSSNPLGTLLSAAVRLKSDSRLAFVFVGGGAAKAEVEQTRRSHGLANLLSLPYQPLGELNSSLSAADVHVVSLGNHMVGIIHPSKVYGILAVGRPLLYLGPAPSHVSEIIQQHGLGWQVDHGDVDHMVAVLQEIASLPPSRLAEMGVRARQAFDSQFARQHLCGGFSDLVADSLRLIRA